MKDTELPNAIVVDVCWRGDRIVVARHDGARLVVEAWVHDLLSADELFAINTAGNAGQRIIDFDGSLWLAYRDSHDVGHLLRTGTNPARWTLAPFYNAGRPFALGEGLCAWQSGERECKIIALGEEPASARTQGFDDLIPTGLSHIKDGHVYSWESQRLLYPWGAGFATDGAFAVAEDFGNRGLVGAIEGHQGKLFFLWREHQMLDPRVDENGSLAAIVAWGRGGPARLALVSAADLIAGEPEPPPIPQPPPTEPPMPDLPASLQADVSAERAKYPALLTEDQPAKILNAVAWKHRALGWGLSVKKHGNRVPSPQGVDVAYDILHHKPTDTLWGCFTDEMKATVNWGQEAHHNNPDRPWLAPIAPAGEPAEPGEPGEPGTPPPPSGSIDALIAARILAATAPLLMRITALEEEVSSLPEQSPQQPAPGLPTRVALRAVNTGKLLRNSLDAGDSRPTFDRDDAGSGETFELIPQG